MKGSWDTKRLDQLCEVFADGDWIESKDQSSSGIRLVQTGNIGSGIFKDRSEKARYISDATFERLRCTELEAGDCLVSRLPDPVGRACLFPELTERAITAVDCTIIRFDAARTLPAYFVYFSQSIEYAEQVARLTGGATRQRISRKNLGQITIPLPPLEEQRWIVAVLDEAFAAIATATANAEKNLANARELFEASVRDTFADPDPSWELMTLNEAARDFGRGKSKHRPRNDPKLFGGDYPFIQTGDVRNSDHLIKKYSQTYSKAGLAQSKLWPKGTICITIAANIAETGILDFDACFPDSVIGMVVDPARTSNSYVEYLLQSLKAILQAKGKGSAQANINLATFENERFPFPPKQVQLDIVARLGALSEQVQAMEALYVDKLTALDDLKQSLLHRAFTGELTATLPETIAA